MLSFMQLDTHSSLLPYIIQKIKLFKQYMKFSIKTLPIKISIIFTHLGKSKTLTAWSPTYNCNSAQSSDDVKSIPKGRLHSVANLLLFLLEFKLLELFKSGVVLVTFSNTPLAESRLSTTFQWLSQIFILNDVDGQHFCSCYFVFIQYKDE